MGKIKKRKGKMFALLCAACVLAGVLADWGVRIAAGAENAGELPTMIVGSDNYPPYNYEDADGELTGIDVDLATEAFRRMGYQAVFRTIDWEAKKELVESGEIDCIWGSFSIDGRENQYQWTRAYMYSRQVVAVRKDSEIECLADLAGKRVAVQSTSKPEEIFLSHTDSRIPQLDEVFSLQNRELLYPYLSKGYVDAIAAHEVAILQCMADYGLEYRILDEPLLTVGLGVAFSKTDDRGLAEALSETIEEMHKDGTLKQILGKYLAEPERFMEVDGYEK